MTKNVQVTLNALKCEWYHIGVIEIKQLYLLHVHFEIYTNFYYIVIHFMVFMFFSYISSLVN